MKGNIAYLCLQATREGQASHAHVLEIIKGLKLRGWGIDLFEPYYSRSESVPSKFIKLFVFMGVQFKLWRAKQAVDLLYIRAHPGVLPTVLWAKIKKVPIILEVNAPYEELFVSFPWMRYFGQMAKFLMIVPEKLATALIVVSPLLKERMQKDVGQKAIYVIQNGANTALFRPETSLQYPLKKPYAVFFGVLARWQGIDTMMKAVESHEWPSDVSLVIIGDGVERHKIEEGRARNSRIVYLGKVPYKNMSGIIANSILGLSPINKGKNLNGLFSPLKVFEILACGVPAVVTDPPGQADLVRSCNCGLVIPLDDHNALARSVAYLYENPGERKEMGQRGRKVIEAEHSWDKRAEETERVIENVLKEKTV